MYSGGKLPLQGVLLQQRQLELKVRPGFVQDVRHNNNTSCHQGEQLGGRGPVSDRGLDGDRAQQNYFVPRMPPVRERTQNKRIQQLLNEKRRKDLLRRNREGRTDRKPAGL
ncbi:A disintegrin and metalloproteinase with thrombospondin motifs 2 [Dissostichus eleginoides]|uniref:A disintegrin and metalloproteinase with thrombospondin motifs 2 n=1 Tax=Dissostichus eleginoides TaxID=100907 RepID=A0AAD9ERP4_DISEL|nr:A disintegrin and metalloproteinase with thrombospondin motifs 2 [Dissostichus eleginoides]